MVDEDDATAMTAFEDVLPMKGLSATNRGILVVLRWWHRLHDYDWLRVEGELVRLQLWRFPQQRESAQM